MEKDKEFEEALAGVLACDTLTPKEELPFDLLSYLAMLLGCGEDSCVS
jgi:hypothetical protein